MNWSLTIWNMFFNEGKNVEDILKSFDNPLITKGYINNVLETNMFLRKKLKKQKIKPRKLFLKPPRPHERKYILWKFLEDRGGKAYFEEQAKTRLMSSLAKEWGFKSYELRNYKRDFLTGRSDTPLYKVLLNKEINRRRRTGERRERVKKVKELW